MPFPCNRYHVLLTINDFKHYIEKKTHAQLLLQFGQTMQAMLIVKVKIN